MIVKYEPKQIIVKMEAFSIEINLWSLSRKIKIYYSHCEIL